MRSELGTRCELEVNLTPLLLIYINKDSSIKCLLIQNFKLQQLPAIFAWLPMKLHVPLRNKLGHEKVAIQYFSLPPDEFVDEAEMCEDMPTPCNISRTVKAFWRSLEALSFLSEYKCTDTGPPRGPH